MRRKKHSKRIKRKKHLHCIYKEQLITSMSSKRKKIDDMMNRSNATPLQHTLVLPSN